MTRLIKTLTILGLLLGLVSSASAQSGCGGQFGALKFCGTISGGLPGAVLIPPGGTTPIGGNTVLGNPTTSSALPIATVAPILGIPGTSVGSVSFGNVTSGTIKIQPTTGALGSAVLTLPAITDTLAGFLIANGGTGNALVANNGGIVWSDASKLNILPGTATARQMLQSGATATPAWSTTTWPATSTINRILFSNAANVIGEISTVNGGMLNANTSGVPALTVTPVLGVPTSSQGTLGFAGVTSGTATVTAQGAAGTPTITLPNVSGTLADGASSPLALSATTGNLTCATCVTSSGGGAITGTAPVAVSAAGAVSITGAAGQVLAGASPAFTATPTLGVAGSTVGTLAFANATSGSITFSPPTGALGGVTLTLPDVTDTLVAKTTTDILTNKTLTSSTDVFGGVTMTLGSDATGDIYYRNVSGILTRLPIGSSTNILTVSGGLPSWAAATGGGNVSNSGVPTAGQIAVWTNSTTIKGVTTTVTTQSFATGTAATYTTPAGVTFIEIYAYGPGGGSGGCAATGAGTFSATGGAGAGGFVYDAISSPAASYTYTVGLKGAGGAAGNNTGSAGSAATTVNVDSISAGAGAGSVGSAAASIGYNAGGNGGAASGGKSRMGGAPGQPGFFQTGVFAGAGSGGNGPIGSNVQGAGTAASAGSHGGGGGCSQNVSLGAVAGAAGDDGSLLFVEHYN